MSSSIRIVIRVFPFGAGTTAPRLPLLKLYSFFILFLIHLSFTYCSFSRRYDSNNNVAKSVNDNQDSTEKIPANYDETVFTFIFILNGDGILIFKDANSICKPDAMFLIVRLGFVGIPFVVHWIVLYAQMYTGASPPWRNVTSHAQSVSPSPSLPNSSLILPTLSLFFSPT